MLLVQGAIFGLIYYFLFRFLIVKWNITTPGRETVDIEMDTGGTGAATVESAEKYAFMAAKIYEGLGGADNIVTLQNCITRLRVEVKDADKIDENIIKEANIPGINMTGPNTVQVVIGPQVQFVADEIEKLRG